MLCQSILTLRARPLQLSFRTVRGLAPDPRSIDQTFGRTADSTLTAVGSSSDIFSTAATQMIRFREFNSRCPDLALCFRASLLSKTGRDN